MNENPPGIQIGAMVEIWDSARVWHMDHNDVPHCFTWTVDEGEARSSAPIVVTGCRRLGNELFAEVQSLYVAAHTQRFAGAARAHAWLVAPEQLTVVGYARGDDGESLQGRAPVLTREGVRIDGEAPSSLHVDVPLWLADRIGPEVAYALGIHGRDRIGVIGVEIASPTSAAPAFS